MPRYKVNNGLDYPPNRRAEPGDIVDDLPAKSIPWLLEDGIIELVVEPTKKFEPKKAKKVGDD